MIFIIIWDPKELYTHGFGMVVYYIGQDGKSFVIGFILIEKRQILLRTSYGGLKNKV
jgi:hypothetical protein